MIPCGNLITGPTADAPCRCHMDIPGVPERCSQSCPDYEPGLTDLERVRCEVWTRVMGYHRPVSAFNAGKQAEHAERRMFREAQAPYCLLEGAGHD